MQVQQAAARRVNFAKLYPQYREVATMEMTALTQPQSNGAQCDAPALAPEGQREAERLEEGLPATLDWTEYPALPTPNLSEMRGQATAGCTTVVCIIAMCVGATHGAVAMGKLDGALPPLFLGAVWAAAGVALFCLAGLMFGNPGVIQRSQERCTPLPDGPVRERLLAGQPITTDVRNVEDTERGSFCVRCLVWRKPSERAHHCSTCGRCVKAFDHHCGVFGRCIAGEGLRGNMGFFKIIIAMAPIGVIIALAAVAAASAENESWGQVGMWLGIGIGGYCVLALVCGTVAACFGRQRLLMF